MAELLPCSGRGAGGAEPFDEEGTGTSVLAAPLAVGSATVGGLFHWQSSEGPGETKAEASESECESHSLPGSASPGYRRQMPISFALHCRVSANWARQCWHFEELSLGHLRDRVLSGEGPGPQGAVRARCVSGILLFFAHGSRSKCTYASSHHPFFKRS